MLLYYSIQLVHLAHMLRVVTQHAPLVHPTPTPRQEQKNVTTMPTTTTTLMDPPPLVQPTQSGCLAQIIVLVCLAITESMEKAHPNHVQVRTLCNVHSDAYLSNSELKLQTLCLTNPY